MKNLMMLAVLTLSTATFAEGTYTITGIGANTCFKYLDAPSKGQIDNMFVSWAQGFISAILLSNEEGVTESKLNSEFLRRNLTNYCKEHPTEEFYKAVFKHMVILDDIVV